jgi:hypothetical protein
MAEVPRAPSAQILVSKLEQLIHALGLRGFEILDPLPKSVLVSVQLTQYIPRETSRPAYSPASYPLASSYTRA